MKQSFRLARIVLAKVLAYGNQILLIVESESITGLESCIPYLKLKEIDTSIEERYKQDRKNKHTERVNAADAKRDTLYRQLLHMVGSFLFSTVAEQKSAAVRINRVLRMFGRRLPDQELNTQSTNLNKMLVELSKSEYSADIQLLSIAPVIDLLRAAQGEFDTIYFQREVDQAETHEMVSASTLRPAYEQAIYDMITYAEAQRVVGGDPKWVQVCKLIETLNETFEAQLRTKKSDASNIPPAS